MKIRLLTLGLFLLATVAAHACSNCAYNSLLAQHWHLKYTAISALVPLLMVANRLDVVRSALVLVPYAGFSYWLHNYLLWHAYRGTLGEQLGWWVWWLNLIGVVLLYVISAFPFFRRNKESGLALWQPIAYAVAMVIAQRLI